MIVSTQLNFVVKKRHNLYINEAFFVSLQEILAIVL